MKWAGERIHKIILIITVIVVFINTIGVHGIPFVHVGDPCRGLNSAYYVTYVTLYTFTVSYYIIIGSSLNKLMDNFTGINVAMLLNFSDPGITSVNVNRIK